MNDPVLASMIPAVNLRRWLCTPLPSPQTHLPRILSGHHWPFFLANRSGNITKIDFLLNYWSLSVVDELLHPLWCNLV
jgi:hypothetical protein